MNRAALASLVGGRVDGFFAHVPTGALAVSVYAGERRTLGVGIGPRVSGVGWLPSVPTARTPSRHALVAAVRAHIVDHRVRDVSVDDEGRIWITVGGDAVTARLGLLPGRRGEVRVVGADGRSVLHWPPGKAAVEPIAWEDDRDGVATGAEIACTWERATFESLRSSWLRGATRKRSLLARRADAVRADLVRLGDVPRLQKLGRLLVAQAGRIAKGASLATLEDWEEGGTIDLKLDPARPAKAQAEEFFARARRLQRGEAVMQRRLAETERALGELDAVRTTIEAARDAEALALAIRAAESAGVRPTERDAPSTKKRDDSSRKPFHRYRGGRGRAILVGRGGADNDALTTRHARPHDLWLHAKDVTGAHVIVPLEKGTSCPPELLVDAATLAAHFSDARGEAVVDVSYVERRHVRKPRGSAPGAVTYDHEKVIAVRVEPERIERLLATREE